MAAGVLGASSVHSHPSSAARTPVMISLISTPPLPLLSNCGQAPMGRRLRATLMPRTSSSMPTAASPLQSPGHCPASVGLGEGVGVGTASVGVTVGDPVGVGVGISVCVALGVGLSAGVAEAVGSSVGVAVTAGV